MKKNIPNIITLANLSVGFLAIIFALQGNFFLSYILIFVAVILDWLDGFFARKLKVESNIGKQLDSLSDLVSFGIAPAVIANILFPTQLIMVSSLIFVLAGAYRLARFNSVTVDGFQGTPITLNGIIFPILYMFAISEIIFSIALIVFSMLMISKIKIPKLK